MFSMGWVLLWGYKTINPGFELSVDFRLSGAHGGPREPREQIRSEKWFRFRSKSAPEAKSKSHAWALCVFGSGRENNKIPDKVRSTKVSPVRETSTTVPYRGAAGCPSTVLPLNRPPSFPRSARQCSGSFSETSTTVPRIPARKRGGSGGKPSMDSFYLFGSRCGSAANLVPGYDRPLPHQGNLLSPFLPSYQ